MSTNTQQKDKAALLEAFQMTSSLESFPSGSNLIFLKKYLSEKDFVEAINYIADFAMKAFISVIPDEINQKLAELETKEEVSNAISTIVAVNDQAFRAIDNGIRFGINVVAEAKNINLKDQTI